MSGMGFGNFSGAGNTGTRNPLLTSSGAQVVLTGDGTFYSYTLPANSLTSNGDLLIVETGATFSGAGNAVLAIVMGGNTLASRSWISDISPEDIVIQTRITRVSAAAVQAASWVSFNLQNMSNYNYLPSSAGAVVDLTAANTISVTSSSYGGGTLTSQYFTIASYLVNG